MTAYFLESSAAVKLYVAEVGTAWMTDLMDPAHHHQYSLARITPIEIAAALLRRLRAASVSTAEAEAAMPALTRDLSRVYYVVDRDQSLTELAIRQTARYGLHGYGGVQLASALRVHSYRLSSGLSSSVILSADLERQFFLHPSSLAPS